MSSMFQVRCLPVSLLASSAPETWNLCCAFLGERRFDSFYVNVFDRWFQRQLLNGFNGIVGDSAVLAAFPE